MPQIQLVGGEKDGLIITLPSIVTRPDVYYAVPNSDDEKVRYTKGAKARTALREKLAVLAYVYEKTVKMDKVGWEYRYRRDPARDKKISA